MTGITPWGLKWTLLGNVILDEDGTEWDPFARVGDTLDCELGYVYSARGEYRVRRKQTPAELERSARSADSYAAFMQRADAEWAHLTRALQVRDADAHVWQTGGMCLAIGWNLDDTGAYAMLTTEGPLSPTRADEKGYGYYLGVYVDEDDDGSNGCDLGFDAGDASHDDSIATQAIAQANRLLAQARA